MIRLSLFLLVLLLAGCARPEPTAGPAPRRHEHHAPHGGTPVVLGAELYHVELVLDSASGRLDAYVLDGEMEEFVRIAQPALEIVVPRSNEKISLVLTAVANPATGETVGNTAQFAAQADWLRTTPNFDAVLSRIEIRGTTFTAVSFNFPNGNDRD